MRKLFKALIASRQARANQEIARLLRNSEYKFETQEYVLNTVVLGKV